MNKQGIYIYGFVPSDCFEKIRSTVLKSGIYSIEYGGVSAVVSDTRDEKIEYMDRETLAHILVDHQQKIEGIMSSGCSKIIPVQLGTIVSSGNDVIKILKNGQTLIKETFEIIDNVEEFDVVAVWNNFPDLIGKISETSQVRLLREEIAKKNSYDEADSINIGKLIKQKIDEKNNKVHLDVANSLQPFCLDIKKHETMNDEMPLNSAFLVNRENINSFMETIDNLDSKYADQLNFKIVGPLPCYSFYTLECKVLNKEEIENAKKVLGIDSYKSELDLKKAYRLKAGLAHPDKNSDGAAENSDGFININNAYKILLEYSAVIKQSSENISNEPLYLVKIKK